MTALAIDLYCGLGGWAEGFLAEGYRVVGFDIERHDYGTGGYPGELVIRDVRSIHGADLIRWYGVPAVIVGSSPCQEFSYRAMPWKRAKELPPPYLGMELFQAQFRIQCEASEAAGRCIPMIVENVRGAQKWVGRANWHFGSYYLWGDVPALMPITFGQKFNPDGTEHGPGSWFKIADSKNRGARSQKTLGHPHIRDGHSHTRHLTNPSEHVKVGGFSWSDFGKPGYKPQGFNVTAAQHVRIEAAGVKLKSPGHYRKKDSGPDWFDGGSAAFALNSNSRKAAAALIAKIPFPLAQYIARCFKPSSVEDC